MTDAGLLGHVYLQIDGATAPEEMLRSLVAVTVESSLHLPDAATLAIHDSRLQWIDDERLAPGRTVGLSFRAADGRQMDKIFDGEVVELESEFGLATHTLSVRAFDRLHRLARGRSTRSFLNVTDAEIVKRIAGSAGMKADVAAGGAVHPYVLQENESDLAFVQRRAARVGCLLYADGETLCYRPFSADGASLSVAWGKELAEFRPRLTTIGQSGKVAVRGWNVATKSEILAEASSAEGAPVLDRPVDGPELARKAFGLDVTSTVIDRPIHSQSDAEQCVKAHAARRAGDLIEAEGTCGGNPLLTAGATVRIDGVGTRLSGTYLVTSATHHLSPETGYETRFATSGYSPGRLLDLLAPAEKGGRPGELAIGIVTDNADPQGWGRVKVKFPWLSADHTSDWARLVAPGAGHGRGMQWLPEINDEVLVGFELGDVHCAYVIGGLWNGVDRPPSPNTEPDVVAAGKVQKRILQSRTGHKVVFDDGDDGGILFEDRKGNRVRLAAGNDAGILFEDSQGNRVRLDTQANKLTADVQGNVELRSRGKLTVETAEEVTIRGNGVTIDAGGGNVTIKGRMIDLN